MSAAILVSTVGLLACAIAMARAVVEAAITTRFGRCCGSIAIGSAALAGVVFFMARTATLVLA
nr:hypothetical protein [uncultured Sphingomonas sp.]